MLKDKAVERVPKKKTMLPHVRDALSRFFVVHKSDGMLEKERKKLQRTANFRLMLVSKEFLQTFRWSLQNSTMTLQFGKEGGQSAFAWKNPQHAAARVKPTELTAIAGLLQDDSFGGLVGKLELTAPWFEPCAFPAALWSRFIGVPRLMMEPTLEDTRERLRVLQALGPHLRELECPSELLREAAVPKLRLEKFANHEEVEKAVDLNVLFKHAIRCVQLRHVCGLFGDPPVPGSESATEELRLAFARIDVCKLERFDRLRALSSMPRLTKASIEFGRIHAWSDGEYLEALDGIRKVARFARDHCAHAEQLDVCFGMPRRFHEPIAKLPFIADKQPSFVWTPFSPEDAARLPEFEENPPSQLLKWTDDGIAYFVYNGCI